MLKKMSFILCFVVLSVQPPNVASADGEYWDLRAAISSGTTGLVALSALSLSPEVATSSTIVSAAYMLMECVNHSNEQDIVRRCVRLSVSAVPFVLMLTVFTTANKVSNKCNILLKESARDYLIYGEKSALFIEFVLEVRQNIADWGLQEVADSSDEEIASSLLQVL